MSLVAFSPDWMAEENVTLLINTQEKLSILFLSWPVLVPM